MYHLVVCFGYILETKPCKCLCFDLDVVAIT